MEEQVLYIINTLFIIFSATLIILMAPGFAMLEAGLVRTKNVTSVLTGKCFIICYNIFCFFNLGL